jgi:hypothetical protein
MSHNFDKDIERAFGKPRSELVETQMRIVLALESGWEEVEKLEHRVCELEHTITRLVELYVTEERD